MIRRTTLNTTKLDDILTKISARCIYMHVAESDDHWESTPHTHRYHEICYVVRGRGVYDIDGLEYSMAAGDLFLLPRGIHHGEHCDPNEPFELRFLIIEHTGQNVGWIDSVIYGRPMRLKLGHQLLVKQIMDQIYDEIIDQGEGYLSVCEGWLKMLYATIYREIHIMENGVELRRAERVNMRDRSTSLSKHIREYVLRNISESVCVAELATHFHYHPKYLSQRVKRETGMSLSAYLLSLRLSYAQELLSKTEFSIADIAKQCGFSNASYFYRSFQQITSMTPAQYRRKMRNAPKDEVVEL